MSQQDQISNEKFFEWIEDVKLEKIQSALEGGWDVNVRDEEERTGLHAVIARAADASEKRALECDKLAFFLIDNGADVDALDEQSSTPLLYAARYRRLDVLRRLLEKGANVNVINNYGKSALSFAALKGSEDYVRALLEAGADPRVTDGNNQTVLHLATARKKAFAASVRLILEKAPELLNRVDSMGFTALGYAESWEAEEVIAVLREAGGESVQAGADDVWIKKANCPSCGAPKTLPSSSPYVYCDYCASFMDYDYTKIVESHRTHGAKLQEDPVARAEAAEKMGLLAYQMEEARQKGDETAYRSRLDEYFKYQFMTQPELFSPRIRDPQYKEQLIKYSIESYSAAFFSGDAEVARLEKEKDSWQNNQDFSSGKAGTVSFFKLFDAYRAYNDAISNLYETKGIRELHPDGLSPELQRRIGLSSFVQIWLPYLMKADADRLLSEAGIAGEFVKFSSPPAEKRHCGQCGGTLLALADAKKTVCEGCGRIIDIADPEIPCTGCGNPLSFPEGVAEIQCPSCEGGVKRALRMFD